MGTNKAAVAITNLIEVNDHNFSEIVFKATLPVIVDFTADWCPPCRALAPTYKKLSQEYGGKVLFASCNVDDSIQVQANLHIQAAPTLAFFFGGQEIARVVGPHPSRVKDFIERGLATCAIR